MDRRDQEILRRLQSSGIVEDVAELLAKYASNNYPLGCDKSGREDVLSTDKKCGWQRVAYSAEWMQRPINVYFLFENDRFVVMDNAETVAALRLKTSSVSAIVFYAAAGHMPDLGGVFLSRAHILMLDNVSATDLPAAICRVLTAAFKITCLDDQISKIKYPDTISRYDLKA